MLAPENRASTYLDLDIHTNPNKFPSDTKYESRHRTGDIAVRFSADVILVGLHEG